MICDACRQGQHYNCTLDCECMTTPPHRLQVEMSEASEEGACATWENGCEYSLWAFANGGPFPWDFFRTPAPDESARLRALLLSLYREAGGWWTWTWGGEPRLVPAGEWEALVMAAPPQPPPTVGTGPPTIDLVRADLDAEELVRLRVEVASLREEADRRTREVEACAGVQVRLRRKLRALGERYRATREDRDRYRDEYRWAAEERDEARRQLDHARRERDAAVRAATRAREP